MNTESTTAAYVSRQPIYRNHMDVYGYELLFRDSVTAEQANISDPDRATAEVILNFIEIGLEEIIGDSIAFINLTRNFILDGHCAALPKERIVMEVLENVTAEPAVIESLRKSKEEGYRIALDDFVYREDLEPLIELADIVKVDVMANSEDDMKELISKLQKFDVRLVAEKVETQEQFELCSDLGFDYFQGYFFCKPKLVPEQA